MGFSANKNGGQAKYLVAVFYLERFRSSLPSNPAFRRQGSAR